jgi:hypothetical protein
MRHVTARRVNIEAREIGATFAAIAWLASLSLLTFVLTVALL